jgi:sugar phosphate isomerase/epimerase
MPEPPRCADLEWVLWAGTIGFESSIGARVDAAQAAGYSRVSVTPLDVQRAEQEGTKADELGRYLRDSGLTVVIDPVMNWYGSPLSGLPLADVSVDGILGMAEDLGADSIGAIGKPISEGPVEELAKPFAKLCDRARDVGASVHLEFMPMLAINDLATAWTIVSGAGRSNGGLLFDTWHFFRGNPDFSTLAGIPGDRIFGVQVADAQAEVSGELSQDTFNRLMPGDGSLDLASVMGTLDRTGGLRSVGPEVISPATASMAPADAARRARDRIEDLVSHVRSLESGQIHRG